MKVVPSKRLWRNGELVPWDEARVHVLAHVIHYGSGVFEGLRAYATPGGPAIVRLEAHVERLLDSCAIIGMPIEYSREQLCEAVVLTVRDSGLESCYVRPFAFRGYGELGVDPSRAPVEVVVAAFPWGALMGSEAVERGVDVGVSSWRRMAPDTHPAMAKAAGNYLNSQLVVMEAKRHGYAEGVVLDVDGYVCEGSGENIFFVQQGELLTPPVGSSILPGITRECVIRLAEDAGLRIREQRVPREMLYTSDEVFFTGTAAEVTPVRSVDGRTVGSGEPGPVTRRLQAAYFEIVQGRAEDRHGWLTHVRER
jgi:branched-chain amino acid aminotransferase